MRSTATTRSSSWTLIIFTPWALRPVSRISATVVRMVAPTTGVGVGAWVTGGAPVTGGAVGEGDDVVAHAGVFARCRPYA